MLIRLRALHGIAVPIHLPQGGLALIGMQSDTSMEEFQSAVAIHQNVVMLLAYHFHDHVESLLRGDTRQHDDEKLSERELQCLEWVANGKSTRETADILGLAEITVRFHIGNASRKLGAVNRIHAVAKAISAGLFEDLN